MIKFKIFKLGSFLSHDKTTLPEICSDVSEFADSVDLITITGVDVTEVGRAIFVVWYREYE